MLTKNECCIDQTTLRALYCYCHSSETWHDCILIPEHFSQDHWTQITTSLRREDRSRTDLAISYVISMPVFIKASLKDRSEAGHGGTANLLQDTDQCAIKQPAPSLRPAQSWQQQSANSTWTQPGGRPSQVMSVTSCVLMSCDRHAWRNVRRGVFVIR